jgi:formylglycine-generating enzyme required for sulfatase activity
MSKDVFISYSKRDNDLTVSICRLLETNGVSCWMAPRDVPPGNPFDEAIIDAIESTKATILVLSKHANASRFVWSEVNRAFTKGRPIFTVRVENVEPAKPLELYLARDQWIDAFSSSFEETLHHLGDAICVLLRRQPLREYGDGGDCTVTLVHIEARDTFQLAQLLRANLLLGNRAVEVIDRIRGGEIVEVRRNLPLSGARKLWKEIRSRGGWASVTSASIEATPHIVKSPTGILLARIPAGGFNRRSLNGRTESAVVRIRRPYLMMTVPVTRQLFRDVMGGVRRAQRDRESPLLPMTGVAWDEVMELCARLNAREQLAKGSGYRPPTEAEWELAARAGRDTEYSGSNSYHDVAWYEAMSPAVVGERAPNAWGLYDMSGNVEEICLDHYREEPAQGDDPLAEVEDPRSARVAKGGSYRSKPTELRISARTPATRDGAPWLGIRLVRGANDG